LQVRILLSNLNNTTEQPRFLSRRHRDPGYGRISDDRQRIPGYAPRLKLQTGSMRSALAAARR